MNKQELIDYCNAIKENKSQIINCIDVNRIIKRIEQLDEPQKIQVPQFVADYIKYAKENDWDLIDAMKGVSYEDYDDLVKWFYKDDNQETFALSFINGYHIEKEKRYLVKAKGVYLNSCLIFEKTNKKWFFSSIYEIDHQRGYHTRKELEKAGFGWVFDCPGIEIEEVE